MTVVQGKSTNPVRRSYESAVQTVRTPTGSTNATHYLSYANHSDPMMQETRFVRPRRS